MKIFTFYYDRYMTATTSEALKGIDHTIICHWNKKDFQNIHGPIIETGKPKGLAKNFNWVLDNKMKTGEWAIFCSDDYKKSMKITDGEFQECNIRDCIAAIESAIFMMGGGPVHLIGLGLTANAFYAKNEYGKKGLVDGRMFAIKKSEFLFDEEIQTIPDYEMTAYHLKNYGQNLILNHFVCEFERYKPGGLGSINDRQEQKIADCKKLVNLYYPLVRFKEKAGQPENSHIRIYG